MMFYKVWTIFCCLLFASAFVGCGSDDEESDSDGQANGEAFEAGVMLDDFANTVVLATYTELDNKADELLAAVNAFADETNQANLEKAQQAWKATRKPWEQSEAFLFGPVDTQGLDPALDSWPVNHVDLQSVLASDDDLSVEYVGPD